MGCSRQKKCLFSEHLTAPGGRLSFLWSVRECVCIHAKLQVSKLILINLQIHLCDKLNRSLMVECGVWRISILKK